MNDTTNCRARLWRGFHEISCSRRATRDGYCGQHHPDAEAARRAKSRAKWEEKQDNKARAINRVKAEALREAADAVPSGGWDHVDVRAWLHERAKELEAGL